MNLGQARSRARPAARDRLDFQRGFVESVCKGPTLRDTLGIPPVRANAFGGILLIQHHHKLLSFLGHAVSIGLSARRSGQSSSSATPAVLDSSDSILRDRLRPMETALTVDGATPNLLATSESEEFDKASKYLIRECFSLSIWMSFGRKTYASNYSFPYWWHLVGCRSIEILRLASYFFGDVNIKNIRH